MFVRAAVPVPVTALSLCELTHSLGLTVGRIVAVQRGRFAANLSRRFIVRAGLQLVSVTPSTVPKAVPSRGLPRRQITGGLCCDNTACVGPPSHRPCPLTNPGLFFPVARASDI